MLVPLVFALIFQHVRAESGEGYRSYANYRVYRAYPQTEHHHKAIREALEENCEMLKTPHSLTHPVDVLCSPAGADGFLASLARGTRDSVGVQALVHDLGQLIQAATPAGQPTTEQLNKQDKLVPTTTATKTSTPIKTTTTIKPTTTIKTTTTIKPTTTTTKLTTTTPASTINLATYQRYDAIINWMTALASAYPSFIRLLDMGRTVQNRKLYALMIGTSPQGTNTRAVWIDGGIHAREWIAVSTANIILNNLINSFLANNKSDSVLAVDWYVAPLLNPDGYEYAWTNDRLWRKNRRPAPAGSSCIGVDLNRNWNVTGYGVGASTDPCSEVYKGTAPNTEPEVAGVAATVLPRSRNIRVYLTLHSYGQDILTSWGYTSALPPDYTKITALANKAAAAMKVVNPNRVYTVETGAALYPAGGASDDWAKIVGGIPYSYTLELADTGTYGFVLPASYITPVGAEAWAAVKVMGQAAALEPLGA